MWIYCARNFSRINLYNRLSHRFGSSNKISEEEEEVERETGGKRRLVHFWEEGTFDDIVFQQETLWMHR